MGQTLQQQLSSLPIPRLTTVLRVDFSLDPRPSSFEEAALFIVNWWNDKAKPYETAIRAETDDLSFSRTGFQLDFARTDDLFALSMQEPDSTVPGRVWMCDFALTRTGERSEFAVRVSYRQPQDIQKRPDPRSPRFLPEVLDRIGAFDVAAMKPAPQFVDLSSAASFVELVVSPFRRLPVIAISEDSRSRAICTDANKLARVLAGAAHVRRLDADVSWKLSQDLWTKDFSTFQGAVRCYNPLFSLSDDKYKHRLWMPERIQSLDAFTRDGFLNAVAGHVFTLVTAQFESLTLLTPSMVRRRMEQQRAAQMEAELKPVLEALEQTAVDLTIPAPLTVRETVKELFDEDGTHAALEVTRELQRQNKELSERNETLDARLRGFEDELNQERAGKAEVAVKSQEQEELLTLYEQDNKTLLERTRLATGDVSQETSEALKPLWTDVSAMVGTMQNIAAQFRRLEREASLADELRKEVEQFRMKELSLCAQIDSLNKRAPVLQASAIEEAQPHREEILKAARSLAKRILLSTPTYLL